MIVTVEQYREVVEILVARELPENRREAALQLLNNQISYFEKCAEGELMNGFSDPSLNWGHNGAKSWADTFQVFGEDWIQRFLYALTMELKTTSLFDLTRFEIAKQNFEPVTVAHYVFTAEESIVLRFCNFDMEMKTHKGPRIDWGDDMLCDWDGSRLRFIREEMWSVWSREVFNAVIREVLRDMLEAARTHGFVLTTLETLCKDVERESAHIHRITCAGPANILVVSGEVLASLDLTDVTYDAQRCEIQRAGLLDGRWEVYVDPFFPDHEALLYHHTDKTAHAGMMLKLYSFSLPGHMESTRIKYGKRLISPEFFTLLRIQ